MPTQAQMKKQVAIAQKAARAPVLAAKKAAAAEKKRLKAEKAKVAAAQKAAMAPARELAELRKKCAKLDKQDRAAAPAKAKRAPSAYNNFVRQHSQDADIKALPAKQRLAAIAIKWRSSKMSQFA